MGLTLGPHDVHVRYRLIDTFGEDEHARAVYMLPCGDFTPWAVASYCYASCRNW